MNKFLMTAGAALFALSTTADAASLAINGGVAGTIPSAGEINEVLTSLGIGPSIDGFFGASISATLNAGESILVEIMGYEAGLLNSFTTPSGDFTSAGGMLVAADLSSPLARWTTDSITGGLLDFVFGTSGPGADVANGDANTNVAGVPNFFSVADDDYIWLFFDDGLVGDPLDNHDDLVVRLSAVPVPAAMIPLLTGLAGLGVVGMRRRRKA